MKMRLIFMTLIAAYFTSPASEHDSSAAGTLLIEPVLADLPYNCSEGGRFPSMNQTLSYTASLFDITGFLADRTARRIASPVGKAAAVIGIESAVLAAAFYLPGGTTWLHEEFHRAVLSNRNITSYNTMYNFSANIMTVSVNNVADSALTALKFEHSAEQVRLASAGHESQICLTDRLLENSFFEGVRFVQFPIWYELGANTGYMIYCQTDEAESEIVQFNSEEFLTEQRDIVGWDYTAWVYDLHRPDESYLRRGEHVSQTGIDRYITMNDLTDSEKKYLKTQTVLSFLNFVRPQIFGIKPFTAKLFGLETAVTGSLEHQLTPFGSQIGVRVLAKNDAVKLSGRVSLNSSDSLLLPELELALRDLPIGPKSSRFRWSPSASIGAQPKELRFDAHRPVPCFSTAQRIEFAPIQSLALFAETDLKSYGWRAGEVNLEKGYDFRLGVNVRSRR